MLLTIGTHSAGAADLPAGDWIARRLLERSEQIARAENSNRYAYEKRSVVEELDDRKRVTKSTEKLYKVILIRGLPFTRLVKIQGRELTEAELAKEDQRELAFRKRMGGVDVRKKAAKRESMITSDLVNRFDFKVLRREIIRARPTLVVSFTPKPSAVSDKTIPDKVLSRVAGTVWVDEEEFEVTRLQTELRSALSLGWLGFVGSLTRCDIALERQRMPDGVWVNLKQTILIVARKLFESMHYRTTEASSGFRIE